ncbi:MAG: glucose-1-phosphate thymidylyltransferase, partial [Bacteroidota bacterium]|nr:glucose-1-phosphate thymidylyltransferase [Bacteroidota bacterium]
MEKIVFTEEFCRPENLFPFTLTRQIQDIRVGILTIREKWEQYLSMPSFDKQEGDYKDLERAIVIDRSIGDDVIYLIHGNILPTLKLAKEVMKLKPGQCLSIPEKENCIYCISAKQIEGEYKIKVEKTIESKEEVKEIKYPWDIFDLNRWAILEDFAWLSKNGKKQNIPSSNKTVNEKNIFIEKGAEVENCFLNASEGPIYVAKEAMIMESSMLRGPVSIGEGAIVKMGTKIYSATTIG